MRQSGKLLKGRWISQRLTSSAFITKGVCKSQYSFCTVRILQETFASIVTSVLTITYPKHDANYCLPSENDSVQRVKACMKVIGFGHWTHHILLRTTFRCPLVYVYWTYIWTYSLYYTNCMYDRYSYPPKRYTVPLSYNHSLHSFLRLHILYILLFRTSFFFLPSQFF